MIYQPATALRAYQVRCNRVPSQVSPHPLLAEIGPWMARKVTLFDTPHLGALVWVWMGF